MRETLQLVRQALDDIDDRSVSVTARRTARIATLLGDTPTAVWLGHELRALGGLPSANAEDTRRLMQDPSSWGDPGGPAEEAMNKYMENRRMGDDKVSAHGLAELEDWLLRIEGELADEPGWLETEIHYKAVIERVRHSCFASLCAWERQLSYANINEQIFERFRSAVDAQIATEAPHLVDQFAAAHRRLRDATSSSEAADGEELSQATATCRRILKAVIDHLLPGERGAISDAGNKLDDDAYRNRAFEWIKANVASGTSQDAVRAALGGLIERFKAMDQLASKGVHAAVGLAEAELCAIQTYIVAGELLRAEREARN